MLEEDIDGASSSMIPKVLQCSKWQDDRYGRLERRRRQIQTDKDGGTNTIQTLITFHFEALLIKLRNTLKDNEEICVQMAMAATPPISTDKNMLEGVSVFLRKLVEAAQANSGRHPCGRR